MSAFDLLQTARRAASAAGNYLRTVERPGPDQWSQKGSRDFVTGVDREAERLIREVLLADTPGATIVGEELSPDDSARKGLAWIVDPLDGTTNFLHNLPIYGVSIAAAVDGVLQAGVVLDVAANASYTASKGGGAWLDGKRLQVSRIEEPSLAVIGTGFPFKDLARLNEYLLQMARVITGVSAVRGPGAASIDLAWVASGRYDGFWEQLLAPWDVAAGTLLVREAGGIVTDGSNDRDILRHTSIVAGNPAMHEWLMKTIAVMQS